MNPREKAIEGLAAILWSHHFGRPDSLFAEEQEHVRQEWMKGAARDIDALGLVAVDPASELMIGVERMKASEDEEQTLRFHARYLRGLAITADEVGAWDRWTLDESDIAQIKTIARKLDLVADLLLPGEKP